MEPDFWLDKWASAQIGFHAPHPHPLLVAYWGMLGIEPPARVLVPLCGKSLDMCWLARAGCAVVGVELAGVAVDDFFTEHGIVPARSARGALIRHFAAPYTLYHGDFFALDSAELGPIDAIYDRAALIALSSVQRRAYAKHLGTLARRAARMLLITLEYAETQVRPPPFAVSPDEVSELFGDDWHMEVLGEAVSEAKGQPAQETVFRLERR